jgi:hypothetical protein
MWQEASAQTNWSGQVWAETCVFVQGANNVVWAENFGLKTMIANIRQHGR